MSTPSQQSNGATGAPAGGAPAAALNPVSAAFAELSEDSMANLLLQGGVLDDDTVAPGQGEQAPPEEQNPESAPEDPSADPSSEQSDDAPADADAAANDPENPADEPAETDAEDIQGLPEDVQKSVNKRIGKEVAKRKALETQLAEATTAKTAAETMAAQLQQQLEQASAGPARAAGPLDHVQTEEELIQRHQNARAIHDLAEEQLGNLAFDPQGVAAVLREHGVKLPDTDDETELKKAMSQVLQGAKRKARADLEAIPQRAQHLRAQAEHTAQAEKEMPWIKDMKDPRYAKIQEAVKALPELRRLPNWKYIAGATVLGLEVLAKQKAAAAKPAAPVVRPRVPAVPGKRPTAAPTPKPGAAATSRAVQKFAKTGNTEDLVDAIAARI